MSQHESTQPYGYLSPYGSDSRPILDPTNRWALPCLACFALLALVLTTSHADDGPKARSLYLATARASRLQRDPFLLEQVGRKPSHLRVPVLAAAPPGADAATSSASTGLAVQSTPFELGHGDPPLGLPMHDPITAMLAMVCLLAISYAGLRWHQSRRLEESLQYATASPLPAPSTVLMLEELSSSMAPDVNLPLTGTGTDGPEDPETPGGSVTGAATLIAGTMVGAGILALPAETGAAGFGLASTSLFFCWIFMAAAGLLVAEVNLAASKEMGRSAVSIETMATLTLGPWGSLFTSICYLLLHYALLVAYFVKSGAVLGTLTGGALNTTVGTIAFAGAMGGLMYGGSEKGIDITNRVLTAVVVVTFLIILSVGLPQVQPQLLLGYDASEVPGLIPIVFLSLVYHNVVPSICTMLKGNVRQIRKAILLGTAFPTLAFVAWDGVALGSVPYSPGVDPIQVLSEQGSSVLQVSVQVFALAAVTTSAVGFVLGLSDLFIDSLGERAPEGRSKGDVKLLSFGLTILPPLWFSLSYPEVFFNALNFAGVYGVCTLFGVLPPVMAWKARKMLPRLDEDLVPGGTPVLGLMAGSCCLLILDYMNQTIPLPG